MFTSIDTISKVAGSRRFHSLLVIEIPCEATTLVGSLVQYCEWKSSKMKVPCRATRKKLQALAELYQCANEEETPGWKRLPQRSPFIVFILFCMFVVVSLICEEKRLVLLGLLFVQDRWAKIIFWLCAVRLDLLKVSKVLSWFL